MGEVTSGGSPHLSCKRDQIKIRDYMDRRVTTPTWGPPPPCKQALIVRAWNLHEFIFRTHPTIRCSLTPSWITFVSQEKYYVGVSKE